MDHSILLYFVLYHMFTYIIIFLYDNNNYVFIPPHEVGNMDTFMSSYFILYHIFILNNLYYILLSLSKSSYVFLSLG